MMSQLEKEDWEELIGGLLDAERHISTVDAAKGSPEEIKAARTALMSFHTTAAMLERSDLERAGIELEQYVVREMEKNCSVDAVNVFSFAVNSLVENMRRIEAEGGASPCDVADLLDILGVETPEETAGSPTKEELPAGTSPAPALHSPEQPGTSPSAIVSEAPLSELQQLEQVLAGYGGRLDVIQDGGETLVFRFPSSSTLVTQIGTLLSVGSPDSSFAPALAQQDKRVGKVLFTIKDFMMALSSGEIVRAQEILLGLADQQQQAGLYKEIGGMARELHNSLKGFVDVLDPSLREMVVEKLPDSGNRLEHMLELTEKAANTTIDHVEKLQRRIERNQESLSHLSENLGKLKAIGEQAQKRLDDNQATVAKLLESARESHNDLLTVLTAQDYQDLTGQIIQKITRLLKDLEQKLLNVIRTFGVKVEAAKKTGPDVLYGPVHKAKEEALHSQDDVDSLLAEFGF